jgi:hypothetical protein
MAPIGAPLRDCRRELDVQLAGSMLVNLERREVIRLGGIGQSVHRRLPSRCRQADYAVMQRRTAAEHEIAAVRVGMRQMLSGVGRRA